MKQLAWMGLMLATILATSPVSAQCAGDCGADGSVTVDEIITGVNIALGTVDVSQCEEFDTSSDEVVTVDEIIAAVNNALGGCTGTAPTATATPQASPTPTTGIVSSAVLGVWSGLGVNAFTGQPRNVRVRVEVVGGSVVITDLGGNLFVSGSTITVMTLSPTMLFFARTSGNVVETVQIGLVNGQLNGTYSSVTTTLPPTGVSIALSLNKE